jgi:ubiquinone biosynthesis protein
MPIVRAPGRTRPATFARTRHIAAVLARHGLSQLLDSAGLPPPLATFRKAHVPHLTVAKRLRQALGELGATFTKLGQMLSTRSDLLPEDVIAELSHLTDDAPPVPWHDVRALLESELGGPVEAHFAAFDPCPLASASIGQVHAATLPDGRSVVVKVQRPGVEAEIEQDLEILRRAVAWAAEHTEFGRLYDLRALHEEFARTIREELDYRLEAMNAGRLRRLLAVDNVVRIPVVHEPLSRRRVLTLERLGGIRIGDPGALERAGVPGRIVAENAVRLFLRQVFEAGFFHADPHVGNFFVRPDGSLVLLDFGMVGRVSPELQERLLATGLAAIRRDPDALTDGLFSLGLMSKSARHAEVRRDVERLLDRYAGVRVADLAAADLVREFTDLAFRHRLQLPGELAQLVRVLAMSEGLGLRVAPEFKFFDYASPILKDEWKRRHTPRALLRRAAHAVEQFAESLPLLPRRLERLARRAEQGEFDLRVKHEGLEEFSNDLERMTRQLALAILLGATIVALGLSMVVVQPPRLKEIAGGVLGTAFVASLVLGVLLLVSIWRPRKH